MALLLGAALPASAQTLLYDSGGFESPRFSAGALENQDPAVAGQSSTSGPWLKSGPSIGTVQTSVVQSGTQAVRLQRTGGQNAFYGVVKTQANPDRKVIIEWDMRVSRTTLPSGSFGPFFSVQAYDALNNTPLLAGSFGVDAATGELLYQETGTGNLNVTGDVASFDTWHHYKIELDYATDTCTYSFDGAVVETEGFVDSGVDDFTDADLAVQPAAGDSTSLNASGTAYFDNYTVSLGPDTTPPAVSSIVRSGDSPTNDASVSYTVTFFEAVTGVDASDFSLSTTGGVSGASVTGVSGSGDTYTVQVSTGTGDGTLTLGVMDDDSITDASGNPLGGGGVGNGNSSGETYMIDKTNPAVTLTTPADGATYKLGEAVSAAYSCSDGGSGIAAVNGCVGDVANGDPIDTASPGGKSFTVTAADAAGNSANTTVNYTVEKGTDGAAHVSSNIPSTMISGLKYLFEITMQNTGTSYWMPGVHRLGNPRGHETLRAGNVVAGSPVAPGGSYTFRFYVTAPSTPGTYTPRWQMKHPTDGWFGPITPAQSITVADNDAEYVSQSVPTTMTAGSRVNVSVTMRNTGTTTWTSGGGYMLGVQNPQNSPVWQVKRVGLPSGVSVAPGQSHTFSFRVFAPAAPGTYNFQWKMLQNGVEWFGGLSENREITVP